MGWVMGWLLWKSMEGKSVRQIERAFWSVVLFLVVLFSIGFLMDVLLPP